MTKYLVKGFKLFRAFLYTKRVIKKLEPGTMSILELTRPGRVVVDLAKIKHNYQQLSQLASDAKVMAVVKANAYGHGIVPVSLAIRAAGCAWYGVAQVAEALQLAQAFAQKDIVPPTEVSQSATPENPRILAWMWNPRADLSPAVQAGLDISIGSYQALCEVSEAAHKQRTIVRVHVEVDTGMCRSGVRPVEFKTMVERVQTDPYLKLVGAWSHLARADEEEKSAVQCTMEQIKIFEALVKGIDLEVCHLAATAGTVFYPCTRFNLVRAGIGLYGLSPNGAESDAIVDYQPVMRLEGEVVAIREVPARTGVSYGHTFVTRKNTRLATVGIGYADGVPRLASGKAKVFINGKLCALRGRICMDQFVVEVPSSVRIGDTAVLWGDPGPKKIFSKRVPSVNDWARWSQSINYECLARISAALPRVYVNSEVGD